MDAFLSHAEKDRALVEQMANCERLPQTVTRNGR
jgi:hypothetical protein